MKDNCPVMMQSEERNAPWNQEDLPPVQVDCSVCYCMSKSLPVEVSNYKTSEDASGSLYDEGTECFFDDTDFIDEFNNDDKAIGIPTLLEELQRLCDEKIEQLRTEGIMLGDGEKNLQNKIIKEIKHYQTILNASRDWVVDDLDVLKE